MAALLAAPYSRVVLVCSGSRVVLVCSGHRGQQERDSGPCATTRVAQRPRQPLRRQVRLHRAAAAAAGARTRPARGARRCVDQSVAAVRLPKWSARCVVSAKAACSSAAEHDYACTQSFSTNEEIVPRSCSFVLAKAAKRTDDSFSLP